MTSKRKRYPPINPDKHLEHIRAMLLDTHELIEAGTREAGEDATKKEFGLWMAVRLGQLMTSVDVLDHWLSKGGDLPLAWQPRITMKESAKLIAGAIENLTDTINSSEHLVTAVEELMKAVKSLEGAMVDKTRELTSAIRGSTR